MMSNIYELQHFVRTNIFYNILAPSIGKIPTLDLTKFNYKKSFDLDLTFFKGEQPTAEQLDRFQSFVEILV